MTNWYAVDGAPMPLGAHWIESEQAYNFALYSCHATGVTLLLYDPADLASPSRRVALDFTRQKTGRVWHRRLRAADIGPARFYAYAVRRSVRSGWRQTF